MLWWRPEHGELYGYSDGWGDDAGFYFTGTGQVGDQRFGVPNAENGRIRDHKSNGDRLQLLRYLSRNEVRYVGEFQLDPDDPWRWRDGPDALGRTRKMIQFRLLPVNEVQLPDAGESRREIGAVTASEPTATPPSAPEATEVEALKKTEFIRLFRAREQVSLREELQLVHAFQHWLLRERGLTATGLRIHMARGLPPLRADLFIPDLHVLVEAKASAAREHIRMAIGQLLDYGRYLEPPATLCVLTPTQPASDMLALMRSLGMAAAWLEGETFMIEPASVFSVAPSRRPPATASSDG